MPSVQELIAASHAQAKLSGFWAHLSGLVAVGLRTTRLNCTYGEVEKGEKR